MTPLLGRSHIITKLSTVSLQDADVELTTVHLSAYSYDKATVSRWEKELKKRLADVPPSTVPVPPKLKDEEFDLIFGANIEQTLGEYRLMVTELLDIKAYLKRALRTFWALSGVLLMIVVIIGYYAEEGKTAAERNGKHIDEIEREVLNFTQTNSIHTREHGRTQRLVCALKPDIPECAKVPGR